GDGLDAAEGEERDPPRAIAIARAALDVSGRCRMSAHVELEALETLALGGSAPEAERHVAQCAECARELAWLKAERALLARRPSRPVGHLWAEIEKRLQAPGDRLQAKSQRRGPRWAWRTAVAAAGVAAAAVLLIVVR